MNPGALEPQKRLAVSIASLIAPSGGIGCSPGSDAGIQHLQQRHAQDRALQRRDPLQRPVGGVAADQIVKLGLMLARLLGQRERERVHVAGQGVGQRDGRADRSGTATRPRRGAARFGGPRSAQPTVMSSLGTPVRISQPSSVTTTRSSIRTPSRPGR